MKFISQLPPSSSRRRRYNWPLILDGRLRELEWRVDFDCRPSSLLVTIRRAARERGMRVRLHHYVRPDDDWPVVAVQAVGRKR
jgi:hypothetical protein